MGEARRHGASVKLALCLLLVACGGKKKTDDAPHSNVSKLHVSKNDGSNTPIAIDRAFLIQTSPDVYTVHVGAKGSCAAPEGVFGFTFAKRVAPLGHERWAVIDVFSRDMDLRVTNPGPVTFQGTHVGGIDLKSGTFFASGELDAIECPAVKPSGIGVPKVAHSSKAKLNIGGKWIDIRGVTVQARAGGDATDMPNITISTSPKDCSQTTLPATVILERVDKKWSLRGTWIETPVEGVDAPDLTFTASNVSKSPDGPVLELQLFGKAKLGEYTVELIDKAEAIECVR